MSSENSVKFSVCPHDINKGVEKWISFAEKLQEKLGVKIDFQPFYSFEEEKERLNNEFFHIYYSSPFRQLELLEKGYIPVAKFKNQVDCFFLITKNGIPKEGEINVGIPFLKPLGYILLNLDLDRIKLTITNNYFEAFELVREDKVDVGVMYNDTWDQINNKEGIKIVDGTNIETSHIFMVHKSVYNKIKPTILSFEELQEATSEDINKVKELVHKYENFSLFWQYRNIANSILESPFIGMIIYKQKIISANDYFCKVSGFSKEEILGMPIYDLLNRIKDENIKQKMIEVKHRRLKGELGLSIYKDVPFFSKKDKIVYFDIFSDTILYLGEYAGIMFFIDTTKEKRLESLKNLIVEVNDVIIHSTYEEELFAKIVDALVNKIGLELVWVGKEDKDGWIKPLYSGGEKSDFLKELIISSKTNMQECQGPICKAYKENKIYINPDSETLEMMNHQKEKLIKYNLLSFTSIPIKLNEKPEYILSLYSKEKNFFNEDFIDILENIKEDIEFALQKINKDRENIIIGEVVNNSKSWVVLTNKDGNIIFANDYVSNVSGYSQKELIGKNMRIFKSGYHNTEFYQKLWSTIKSGNPFDAIFVNRAKDGSIFYMEQTIYPITLPGNILRYVGIGIDITKEQEMSSELNKLKYYDALTSLYNLNGFTINATEKLKNQEYQYLILIDIANFTDINKTYGFDIGDSILEQVANIIKSSFGENNIIGRIGGDEFAVLSSEVNNIDNILLSLEKLKNAIKNITINKEEFNLPINAGIAMYPKDDKDFNGLHSKASITLKDAKAKGNGIIKFYNKELEESTEKMKYAEKLIIMALKNDRFRFFYQPYFKAENKTLAGFEALVRIIGEDGKIYTPNFFIDYLENSEYLRDFERWALNEGIKISRKWKLPISINISAKSFSDEAFLSNLLDVPDDITITYEITERTFVKEFDKVKNFTNYIIKNKKNVRMAIDDFGTGYSSLIYLKELSANILKIDMSFVKTMLNNEKDAALVKTIIDLARNLKMDSLAEGVETQEQYEMLKNMGCNYIQGFLLGKPMPKEEAEKLFKV